MTETFQTDVVKLCDKDPASLAERSTEALRNALNPKPRTEGALIQGVVAPRVTATSAINVVITIAFWCYCAVHVIACSSSRARCPARAQLFRLCGCWRPQGFLMIIQLGKGLRFRRP